MQDCTAWFTRAFNIFNGLQLKKSTMLADVLNEKAEKNSTTAQNFKNLNALMMIMATEGMHAIFTL